MDPNRIRLRTRAFRAASRLLHSSGMLSLARPFLNSSRLRVDRSGRAAFPYVRHHPVRNAQILIYHRVNDDRDPYFGGVPSADFEQQMAYVSSHFHVLPLSALVTGLGAKALPDNAIAITLDDGYRDNYLHAFPILQRYSIPATIFLTTSVIGSDRQLWHDDVFSAFRETTEPALEFIGTTEIHSPLTTLAERLREQQELLVYIRTLGEAERIAAVSRLRAALRVGLPRKAPGLMLSWQEAQVMNRAGIQFGSHTVTHPILSRVDRAHAQREILESKRAIEAHLGVPVQGFAYPNGTRADFLPETKSLLQEAGYSYAVTTIGGSNEPEGDVYELHRATPWDEDIFAFGLKLHYNKLRS